MIRERIRELVSAFQSRRVLVVGDLMLDEFLWGKVTRISPEAPVPVVEVIREEFYPGGAANVARNLRPFCGNVQIMGRIGKDTYGSQVRSLLVEEGIDPTSLIEDPDAHTILKTRIIARQQQVVRVDRESRAPLSVPLAEQALQSLDASLPRTDVLILEDYGKGFLSQSLVTNIIALCKAHNVPVAVDPNPHNPLDWTGAFALKPNRSEAFAAAEKPLSDPIHPALEDTALLQVGDTLLRRWSLPLLLITLGEDGMILFRQDGPPYHTPTRAREVFDVSGAGDTAIALFSLALTAGATPEEAAEISNHASGVVVGKLGTATLTPEELLASFEHVEA